MRQVVVATARMSPGAHLSRKGGRKRILHYTSCEKRIFRVASWLCRTAQILRGCCHLQATGSCSLFATGCLRCEDESTMSNPKAIFIDFDGVLHPSTATLGLDIPVLCFADGNGFRRVGLFCWAHLLEEVLASSPDEILLVVHSTWRQQPWATPRLLRELLGPLGHRYQGITAPHLSRQASIEDLCARAGIEDHLILDDARDEFDPDTCRLVITNPLLGISEPAALQAVRSWCSGNPPAGRA